MIRGMTLAAAAAAVLAAGVIGSSRGQPFDSRWRAGVDSRAQSVSPQCARPSDPRDLAALATEHSGVQPQLHGLLNGARRAGPYAREQSGWGALHAAMLSALEQVERSPEAMAASRHLGEGPRLFACSPQGPPARL
jgi:hypothetical protein